ncbi:MAG: hypothetical protein ABIL58_17885 [Pseudomonadota bacterium]
MTIAMAILWVLSWGPAAWAETLTLTAEGEYVMGEGETMAVAGEKARKNAIRAADRLPEALSAWETYLRHWMARDQESSPGGAPSHETLAARERIGSLKKRIP